MANAVIKLKRSNSSGSAPSSGTLAAGELAINTADKKLFSSTDGSDIITISGDRYNVDTEAVTLSGGLTGASIRLTKDGAAYDEVDLLSSATVSVTRESNGAITFGTTAGSTFAGDSGTATPSSGTVTIAGGSGITTSATGTTVTVAGDDATTSAKGVASFASADFDVSSGAVSIKSGGVTNTQLAGSIANAKLVNDGITLSANTGTGSEVQLGDTLSIVSGSAKGITVNYASDTVTISGVDATAAIKGVATFNSSDFATSSGDVTIKALGVSNAQLAGSIAASKLAGGIGDSLLSTISTAGKVAATAIDIDAAADIGEDIVDGDLIVMDNTSGTEGVKSAMSRVKKYIYSAISGDATASDTGAFTIASGAIDNAMLAGSIANSKLVNDGITLSANTGSSSEVQLGDTLSIVSGNATGVTVNYASDAVTISGVDATADIKGVAKFDSGDFDVTSGAVSLKDSATGAVTTIAGTANEIEVSRSNGTVTVGLPNDVTIGNNLSVTGDLTVSGTTTTVSSTTVTVNDSALKLAANQTGANADAVDIGFYGTYNASNTQKFAGLLRDATDGTFILFKDNQSEPTTTLNTGATGHALATLDCVIDGGTY